MKESSNISAEQSLAIISEMIANSKRNFAKGGSFYIVFWGAAIATLSLGHFILDVAFDYDYPYIVWLGIIPAAIYSTVHGQRRKNRALVRSRIDGLYAELWWAIFACILVLIFFIESLGYNITPVILLFSSLGVFITGRLIKFGPLVNGGYLLFLSAIVTFLVPYNYQNLICSVAMILGYLVPGLLLRRQEK